MSQYTFASTVCSRRMGCASEILQIDIDPNDSSHERRSSNDLPSIRMDNFFKRFPAYGGVERPIVPGSKRKCGGTTAK